MSKEKSIVKAQEFSQEQINLIRSQIAPEATNEELQLFLYYANRTGLDPLARQIYCIHRNSRQQNGGYSKKMTIQTSIDGFRVIAERSGQYAGQSEPQFQEDAQGKPIKCTVIAYKFANKSAGIRYEAGVGVAYWTEFVQTDREGKTSGLWAKMPHTMLSKVAEALALRKAFPQDLSGIYSADELPIEAEHIVTISMPEKKEVQQKAIQPPLDDDLSSIDYADTLIKAASKTELAEAWKNIPANAKLALKTLKDERKAALSGEKPSISDSDFTNYLSRMTLGEPGIIDELEKYQLTESQQAELNNILA